MYNQPVEIVFLTIEISLFLAIHSYRPEKVGKAISELSRELSTNQVALFSHRVLK